MKILKGPRGMIDKTTNSRAVQSWENGHHLCSQLLTEHEGLRDIAKSADNRHKEERKERIKSDLIDRERLQTSLKIAFIH